MPNAITPNEPTGLEVAQRLVVQPTVMFAGLADFKVDVARSDGIVDCFSESSLIPGNVPFLAAEPAVAIDYGCHAPKSRGGAPRNVAQTPSPDAVCNARYPSGRSATTTVSGGHQTVYDRQASLEHVCAGFGAPEDLQLTAGMSCALIAAAATYGGPAVDAGSDKLCDTTAIVSGYRSGGWEGASSSVAEEKACGYFSDVFAGGAGLVAAGATSESGPGAAAVGIGTYHALAAFLKVACGGILGGGATSLGKKFEADNETHVALDVIRNGKCILLSQKTGISGTSWHATDCPASAP